MSANTRTIEIPNTESLTFAYRADKDVLKENAVNVTVKVDLSKLTADDILEWAFSAMVVSFQSKLRSKNAPAKAKVQDVDAEGNPVVDADGKPVMIDADFYTWAVPSRGTRTVSDPTKIDESAKKLVAKMGPEQKYNLMVQMGVEKGVASAATGFTPKEAAPVTA
jgi:hypothetical protein